SEPIYAEPRPLGVKVNVLAFAAIEEFAIDDKSCLRKGGAQRQRFTPAAVCEDDIGNESRGCQRGRRHEDVFSAPAFCIKPAREWMRRRDVDRGSRVPQDCNSRRGLRAFGANSGEFEIADFLERLDHISELGRKVIVNEKDLHRQPAQQFWKAATDMISRVPTAGPERTAPGHQATAPCQWTVVLWPSAKSIVAWLTVRVWSLLKVIVVAPWTLTSLLIDDEVWSVWIVVALPP